MDRGRLTHRILKEFFEGRIGQRDFLRFLSEHTLPVCSLDADPEDETVESGPILSEERLHALVAQIQRLPALRRQARRREQRMRTATGELRRSMVEPGSPVLVDRLIARARRQLDTDPWETQALAELAEQVADRLDPREFGEDLVLGCRTRARAHRANALRVQGQLRTAEKILDDLLAGLDELPDPLLRAELWSLRASLYRDQRRYAEAEHLVDRTLAVYREVSDDHDVGRLLLQKASLVSDRGQPEEAYRLCRQAIERLGPRDGRFWMIAHHNAAFHLCQAERFLQARRWLEDHRHILDGAQELLIRWRQVWLRASIAQGLGEERRAEDLFVQARKGFVEAGLAYDAALVSLDLAVLMTRQGRSTEVHHLAEEMMPIFQSQDIHREAFAAYLLFRQAARAKRVTISLLAEVAALLRRSAGHRRPQEKPS